MECVMDKSEVLISVNRRIVHEGQSSYRRLLY